MKIYAYFLRHRQLELCISLSGPEPLFRHTWFRAIVRLDANLMVRNFLHPKY